MFLNNKKIYIDTVHFYNPFNMDTPPQLFYLYPYSKCNFENYVHSIKIVDIMYHIIVTKIGSEHFIQI